VLEENILEYTSQKFVHCESKNWSVSEKRVCCEKDPAIHQMNENFHYPQIHY
jgi:hypothetical protein